MAKFDTIVAGYMRRLINDLGVTVLDSAAVFGNGGHESGGFQTLQEIKPTVKGSTGGYGWFQWTGPRRRAFMAFCKARGLQPHDDEANYQFLVHELRGSERGALAKMAAAKTLYKKVEAFELAYERAGVKHYASRKAWAMRAIRAYDLEKKFTPIPSTPHLPEPRLPEPQDVPLPEAIETKPQPETRPMNTTKPQYKSLTIIGAVLTLISTFGLFGISYDSASNIVSIDLNTVFEKALAATIPGGAVLSWIGRIIAKSRIG